MRSVVFFLVFTSAQALNLASKSPVMNMDRPMSHHPEGGAAIVWQRPKGQVKGILLYLHGCHNFATDMFTPKGKDGFNFGACKESRCGAHKEEMLARTKARTRGYLVAAVQGGEKNENGCTNTVDIPKIKESLMWLKQEEGLVDKPVILMGMSAGARAVPELATKNTKDMKVTCSVIVANEVRVRALSTAPLGVPGNYPTDVPALFIHMPHDEKRFSNVKRNVAQFKTQGVQTGEIRVTYGPKHWMAGGALMHEALSWCEGGGKIPPAYQDQWLHMTNKMVKEEELKEARAYPEEHEKVANATSTSIDLAKKAVAKRQSTKRNSTVRSV